MSAVLSDSATRRVSRFAVPDLGVGVGLRVPHYAHVAEQRPAMPWFEALSENFMVEGGSPLHWLDRVREHYPIVLHGVSMSLGSDEDPDHTRRLRALCDRVDTPWVSDHVCFTRAAAAHGQPPGINTHDLLPVPYEPRTLAHMVDRCKRAADALGRVFAIENPSSYLGFRASSMPEWDFVAALAEQADVGILLDVNNVFVSSVNHGFDPMAYLDAIPADRVVQIHLAGHSVMEGYRLDTHDAPVCDEVWDLYRRVIERIGPVSTLIEWDGNIPSWDRLAEEAAAARRIREDAVAVWAARG
ncbi:MAG: DUF692 domain-containing protein [Myxococcota bacterium]